METGIWKIKIFDNVELFELARTIYGFAVWCVPSENGDLDLVILAAWAQFRVTVSSCVPVSTDTLHIAEDEWGNHTSTTKRIEIFANIVMLGRRSFEDPKYENGIDTRVLSCAFASVVKLKHIPWSVILLVISQRIRRLIERVCIFLRTNKANVISLVGMEFDWIWRVTIARSLQLSEPIKLFGLQRDTGTAS